MSEGRTLWDLRDIASVSDLAREHYLTKSAICNMRARNADFPAPLPITIATHRVYSREAFASWLNGRNDHADNERDHQGE